MQGRKLEAMVHLITAEIFSAGWKAGSGQEVCGGVVFHAMGSLVFC